MSGLPGPWMEPPPEQGAGIDDTDGWCLECGNPFHLDDCGGYNPPCPCGSRCCRSCCGPDHLPGHRDDDDEDDREEEE